MIKQLPIDFKYNPLYERQDFMVSKSNIEAIRLIDSISEWNNFAVCIYGGSGSGKTHLAHIFASQNDADIIKACDIKLENVHGFKKTLVVEDLSQDVNEEALFHLYNLYKNEGGYILFTSTFAPAQIKFKLADLQSRLNSILAVEIKEPDTELLSALIVKLFSDRQAAVSPDVVNYIANNAERSFSSIKKLVAEVDAISISKKRPISIPMVKEAMESLGCNNILL